MVSCQLFCAWLLSSPLPLLQRKFISFVFSLVFEGVCSRWWVCFYFLVLFKCVCVCVCVPLFYFFLAAGSMRQSASLYHRGKKINLPSPLPSFVFSERIFLDFLTFLILFFCLLTDAHLTSHLSPSVSLRHPSQLCKYLFDSFCFVFCFTLTSNLFMFSDSLQQFHRT